MSCAIISVVSCDNRFRRVNRAVEQRGAFDQYDSRKPPTTTMSTTKVPPPPPSNSKITRRFVSFAQRPLKTADAWLECKRTDDALGSADLWRVHDDLYDLRPFVRRHPGGASWLQMTRGTDITEAVETHHLDAARVERLMRAFHVRPADGGPRNSRLTFAAGGFYRTLKRRVAGRLAELRPQADKWKSNLILDALLVGNLIAACLCTVQPWLIAPGGLLLMWLIIGGHNYLHQADNPRMYYFNVALLSFREWRVSHALSHHLFPNSRYDMEMSIADQLLNWWPDGAPTAAGKDWTRRYASWAYEWLVYAVLFVRDAVVRWVVVRLMGVFVGGRRPSDAEQQQPYFGSFVEEAMPLLMPLTMCAFGAGDLLHIVGVWLALVCWGSFLFCALALNAGHHHPDVFHDGDAPLFDSDDDDGGGTLDWGLFQLDTMIDRRCTQDASRFVALTHFGDHILHHLFPTLDHGVLRQLYGVLEETLREFGAERRARTGTTWELVVGQHRQLARVEPTTAKTTEQARH